MSVNTFSSFQKRSPKKSITISGTKPSLANNQLRVSTGIPSLDNVLGGGLSVGSALLLEEDLHNRYGKLLLKYYVAEGVINKHEIFLASADCKPESVLQELPAVAYEACDSGSIVDQTSSQPADIGIETSVSCQHNASSVPCCAADGHDDTLKIAWRYKNLHLPKTERSSHCGHHFDLSRTMPATLLEPVTTTCFDPLADQPPVSVDSPLTLTTHCYSRLLYSVHSAIERGQYSTSSTVNQRNILRIGIHMLGSGSWGDAGWSKEPSHSCCSNSDLSLCQLLYALRSLVRMSYAVCLITIPAHLFQPAHVARLEHLSDAVVRLESFIGTPMESDPTFKDYNGLLHVIKLPQLNTLATVDINTTDLAFKIRRKRFTIEKFHLPPSASDADQSTENAGQDTDTENSEELLASSSAFCCSSDILDF